MDAPASSPPTTHDDADHGDGGETASNGEPLKRETVYCFIDSFNGFAACLSCILTTFYAVRVICGMRHKTV